MRPVDPFKQSAEQFTASCHTLHSHTRAIKSHFAPHIKQNSDAVSLDMDTPLFFPLVLPLCPSACPWLVSLYRRLAAENHKSAHT